MPEMPVIPCPRCDHPMKLQLSPGDPAYVCANCNHRRFETFDEAQVRLKQRREQALNTDDLPLVVMRHGVNHRAMSAYDAADTAINQGDQEAAVRHLRRAVELQDDFLEAHLQLARLMDDPQVKRKHLGTVIAYDAGNLAALRMLMILDGELTEEEAKRTHHAEHVTAQHVEGATKVESRYIKCVVCGGALTTDETNARVYCKFCGHVEPLDSTRSAFDGVDNMAAALLKRKVKPALWIVGEHILHCNDCGAQRTIPATRLSLVCPFCGSQQVIEQDALSTLEKPDALIPFSVSEADAQSAIRERLKSVSERFSGLFNDNRVKSATIHGVYMPFWMFDTLLQISKTTMQKPKNNQSRFQSVKPYEHLKLSDGINGIMIPAVKSPPPHKVLLAANYDTSNMIAYEPKLLARYPAELYERDFVAASLDARGVASKRMRDRYGKASNSNTEVLVSTQVQTMNFILVLAPMWIATLYEQDGDLRTALVNGQTGKVVLGKARKNSA